MPLGYWIFAGLLCFGVAAVSVLGERPGYPATWTKRIFAVLGTVNWIVALSILILRIP